MIAMKKIILLLALMVGSLAQKSFAQDSIPPGQTHPLLLQYFAVRDALVAGRGQEVSAAAAGLIGILNTLDFKWISEGNINILLKDATPLTETQDIRKQRVAFAQLSDNMIGLAKAVRLSDKPLYQVYCPMKNAYWLSGEKPIKNPYFGDTMLSCGKVVETIHH